jgi:hypothetical protein
MGDASGTREIPDLAALVRDDEEKGLVKKKKDFVVPDKRAQRPARAGTWPRESRAEGARALGFGRCPQRRGAGKGTREIPGPAPFGRLPAMTRKKGTGEEPAQPRISPQRRPARMTKGKGMQAAPASPGSRRLRRPYRDDEEEGIVKKRKLRHSGQAGRKTCAIRNLDARDPVTQRPVGLAFGVPAGSKRRRVRNITA